MVTVAQALGLRNQKKAQKAQKAQFNEQKKQYDEQKLRQDEAITEGKAKVAEAEGLREKAKADAKSQVLKKRKSVQRNVTRFTSPLGISTPQKQGDITKKTLLGA